MRIVGNGGIVTLDNIKRMRLAIEGDRRLTVRELKNDLGIPKTTV